MSKRLIRFLLVMALVLAPALAGHTVQAGEHRQHGAHEHGVARLNLAVAGNSLAIELFSPAANIVGFEHHPRTQAQKDQVKEARKRLEAAQTLFEFPAHSQARLVKSMVDTDIDTDSADEPHHHKEAGAHDEDEEDHHAHGEDEHGHGRHSDFKAEYHFVCDKPEKLAYIDVMLASIFPGVERIEVQILTDSGQTAKTLTAKDHRITF